MAVREDFQAGVSSTDKQDIQQSKRIDRIAESNRLDNENDLPFANKDKDGSWMHACFHSVTAIVGAGVLGLPNTMVYLTWKAGVVVHVLFYLTSLFSLWALCDMHEIQGKRFNRYHEMAQYAFGSKLGLIITVPPQLIVCIGLCIVYCVTGGDSLREVWLIVNRSHHSFGLSAWIVVFAAVSMVLCQFPNFHKLSLVSLLAAVMSIGYSTIAIGVASHAGRQPGTVYNLDGFSTSQKVWGAMNSLGTVAFAYGYHGVALGVQSSVTSPPTSNKENPTKKPMLAGIYLAYALVAYCYFGVTFSGYIAYGSSTGSQIINSLGHPKWVVATAHVFIVIHVLGSFQVYAFPMYDMIEYQLVKHNIPNGGFSRVLYRVIYCMVTAFVAITIPFFGALLGFFGALGFGPVSFAVPAAMYLSIKKPSARTASYWICLLNVLLGVVTTIAGASGGLYSIIQNSKSFKFYQ